MGINRENDGTTADMSIGQDTKGDHCNSLRGLSRVRLSNNESERKIQGGYVVILVKNLPDIGKN